jgi:hypothetical protein
MPNHCDNDFTVTGPAADVEAFLAAHCAASGDDKSGLVLDLNTVRPYPAVFAEADQRSQDWEAEVDRRVRAAIGEGVKRWEEPHRTIADKIFDDYIREIGKRPTDGFNAGGYEWCNANWGTKWGCYDGAVPVRTPMAKGRLKVKMNFSTAWSPFDTEILEILSDKFPTLTFDLKYYERGGGFQGRFKIAHGEVTHNEQKEYSGNRGG